MAGPRPADWLEWLNRPQTAAEEQALRLSVRRGRPFVDELWQRETAARLGLGITLRPQGRPRKPKPAKPAQPAPAAEERQDETADRGGDVDRHCGAIPCSGSRHVPGTFPVPGTSPALTTDVVISEFMEEKESAGAGAGGGHVLTDSRLRSKEGTRCHWPRTFSFRYNVSMIAVSFFDALACDDSRTAAADCQRRGQMTELARRYVESALADWQRVLDCESQFDSMTFATPAEQSRVNRSLYEVHQKWAADAEQVLLRTRQLASVGLSVEDAEALEHAFGRVQARLKMTPEMFDRSREQVRRGEFIPMQELRNELRARLCT